MLAATWRGRLSDSQQTGKTSRITKTSSTRKPTCLLLECYPNFLTSPPLRPSFVSIEFLNLVELTRKDHVNFTGDSIGVREAPVTEIAPFHVTAGADDASKSALEDHTLKLAEFAKDSAGASALAVGWGEQTIIDFLEALPLLTISVIEEQDHSDAPEGKTKLLHLLLGWKSVEEHMKAREQEQFPVLIQPIRALTIPAPPGKTVFHVKFHGKK